MADQKKETKTEAPAPAPEALSTASVDEAPVFHTDRVITDPNDPLAVQVPEEAKVDNTLPVVAVGGPSPEETFAKDA